MNVPLWSIPTSISILLIGLTIFTGYLDIKDTSYINFLPTGFLIVINGFIIVGIWLLYGLICLVNYLI